MRKSTRSWKERIGALLLAVAMVITWMLPNAAFSAEAAPEDENTIGVSFDVQDQDFQQTLSNFTITVKDEQGNVAGSLTVPNADNQTAIPLKQGTTYRYEVVKAGYNDAAGSLTVTEQEKDQPFRIYMKMSDIQIQAGSGEIKSVGDWCDLSVTNKIEGAVYTWQSSNSAAVTVDGNGRAIAVGEGEAKITASCQGKVSNEITFSPKRIATDMTISLTADKADYTDVRIVACNVSGLPADATGTVEFTVRGSAYTVPVSGGSASWIYTNQEPLMGQVEVSAHYSGDAKYSECSTSSTLTGLKRTYELSFTDGNSESAPKLVTKDVKNPDKEITFDVPVQDETLQGREERYTSSDPSVLKVDQSGKVTVVGNGKAYILVEALDNGTYLKAEKKYYVYSQKPVDIESLNLTADPVTDRIYNAGTDVNVQAGINESDLKALGIYTEDLDTAAGLTFQIKGNIDGADVKAEPYKSVSVQEITDVLAKAKDGTDVSIKARIELSGYEKTDINADVTVVARTVYLGTADFSIAYGKNIQEAMNQTDNLVTVIPADEKNQTGLVGRDTIDVSELRAKVDNKVYDVGTHASVIKPDMSQIEEKTEGMTNYQFAATPDETQLGTLTVEKSDMKRADILKNIRFYVQGGNCYQDDQDYMWISEGTLKAEFRNTDVKDYFDQVILTVNGRDYDLCAADGGFSTENLKQTQEIKASIQLQNSKFAADQTEKFTYNFTLDKTEPDFSFGNWAGKTKVTDSWMSAITFNNYQRTYYSVENVKASDQVVESALDEVAGTRQSGVKDWKYYIYKVGSDEELTQDNLIKTIKSAQWQPGEGSSIPVVTEKNGELSEVEGNYVVLVQVSDNVGNTAVYSSNGLVVDVTQPRIEITQEDGSPINADEYYGEDVQYKITLTDGDVCSGLEFAKVELYDDDQLVDSQEYDIDDLDVDYTKENGYSLQQIDKKLSSYIIRGTIPCSYDSNNLTLKVTAYDQTEPAYEQDENAGNKYTVSQKVMVDNVNPEITVSYNNDTDVKNGKYFNSDRVMTIKYKEKNFDKDGVTFDVKAGSDIDSMSLAENVTVSQLKSAPFDIDVSEFSDSEPDNDESTYTNNRVNTLVLTFNKDNEYYIVPHVKDLAGRTEEDVNYEMSDKISESVAKTIEKEFVIDKTEPVIKVNYSSNGQPFIPKKELLADGERAYSKAAVTAVVSIDEKNFWLEDGDSLSFADGQFSLDGLQAVDSRDNAVEAVKTEDYLKVANEASTDNWGSAGNVRTNNHFYFDTDANYTFAMTYTDLAGNTCRYENDYFTVDKPETGSPEGTITLDDGKSIWSKLWIAITFNIFHNTDYDVNIVGQDATSGVKKVEYYKVAEPVSENTNMYGLNWTDLAVAGEKAERSGSFSVAPNQQFVVYEKVTDYAGNVTFIYPSNGVVMDNELPRVTVTQLNPQDARNGIYNEDIHLRIEAEDPVAGDTYSGLEHVWYNVTVNGNTSYEETIDLLDLRNDDSEKYQSPDKRTFTKDIVIPASENYNSNDIKVQAFVTDFSQNTGESEVVNLKMDITEPTINVTYDLNSPMNGRYYNQTRTATVTVTERNFDPSAVVFNISNTDGVQPAISGWSSSADAGVSDNATHTCTVTFAADGDYTFTLNTTDLAGNASHYTTVDDFTIDQTDPVVQVSYDNNKDAEPGYFNADRTATITVTEHNFNAAEVNTAITASLNGNGAAVPGLGGWSNIGDVHTASVTFSADADYTFDVDYTDLAGNAAADYQQDSFTIDQTAPELEFFDIEDRSANNDVVAPGVRYSDNNYTENGVEITLTGAENGAMTIDGDHSSIPYGESIKMADFERVKEKDDLYTMSAVITDRAGNRSEDSVVFSVNRFGSVYVLSDATKKLLSDYYTDKEQDIVVTEINVDSLVFNGISYGRDGKVSELKDGRDYTVRASGSDDSWKQYNYTVKKENFEKEGNYTVTIDSEDRATNIGNNRAKGCDIRFAVDKTAPTVVITGIEDDAQYRANSRNITVNVSDNIAMKNVSIYAGDELKTTFSATDIKAADGKPTYKMESLDSRQDVRAVAVDQAGNKAETEIAGVLLTSNLFVQFYSNTPLLIGTIVVVVVIIGGLLWFFLIFKKKEKQANK